MPPVPSRSVLAALGLAALLLTAGCLSGVDGPGAATETDAPSDATTMTDDEASVTDETTHTATDTATEPPSTPTATPEAGPSSVAELESTFQSRMSSLESFTATRSQTMTFDNRTESTTAEVWFRLSTGEYRTEVVEPDERAGDVVVAGTDTVWIYQEAENEVSILNRSGTDAGDVSATVVQQLATNYEVTDYETDTVDGQETYRVTLVPDRDSGVDVTATAWLDRETYFPVAVEQTFDLENRTFSTRTQFEDVTLNASIPDERFTFDPPEDANVETVDIPETETFESLEAMRESADVSVPDPAVPEGYEFEEGHLTHSNYTTVSLQYANDTATLSVSKLGTELPGGDGENVTVGDHHGRVRTYGDTTMVVWTCDGSTYSVSGPLDRAELLDVARSMECA